MLHYVMKTLILAMEYNFVQTMEYLDYQIINILQSNTMKTSF